MNVCFIVLCVCLSFNGRMAWWQSCGYKTRCLPRVDSEGEDMEPDEDDDDNVSWNSTDSDHTAIHYVLGDVTHPQADREDAIIVHCVGTSLLKTTEWPSSPVTETSRC